KAGARRLLDEGPYCAATARDWASASRASIEKRRRRDLRRWRRRSRGRRSRLAQRADSHAEQANATVERDALQALARRAAYPGRVARRLVDGAIARDGLEIVVA